MNLRSMLLAVSLIFVCSLNAGAQTSPRAPLNKGGATSGGGSRESIYRCLNNLDEINTKDKVKYPTTAKEINELCGINDLELAGRIVENYTNRDLTLAGAAAVCDL